MKAVFLESSQQSEILPAKLLTMQNYLEQNKILSAKLLKLFTTLCKTTYNSIAEFWLCTLLLASFILWCNSFASNLKLTLFFLSKRQTVCLEKPSEQERRLDMVHQPKKSSFRRTCCQIEKLRYLWFRNKWKNMINKYDVRLASMITKTSERMSFSVMFMMELNVSRIVVFFANYYNLLKH